MPSNAGGSIPGQGGKIPHAKKNQNMKQKQYCNRFYTNFKNGPHLKKSKKRKNNCYQKQNTWTASIFNEHNTKYEILKNLVFMSVTLCSGQDSIVSIYLIMAILFLYQKFIPRL